MRDYVHVNDLCAAHLLALQWLESGGTRETLNLGGGMGTTVLEVIEAARRETGIAVHVSREARRPGDPAELVAGTARAERVLGWVPVCSDIGTIVRDGWRRERRVASS